MRIAIVSGASSGLGAEYVRQLDIGSRLAMSGDANYQLKGRFSQPLDEIWVIARRQERLKELKTEVKTPVRVLALDLTRKEALNTLSAMLASLCPDVRVLINAAGFGKIGSWQDISGQDAADMIDLNCRAAVAVTQMVLPHMTRGGRILEICSSAAFQPLPYLNVYAATKAFLYRYSRALGRELVDQGISVTAVCPYWVKDTRFISNARETDQVGYIRSFPFATREKFVVRQSLSDAAQRKPVSTPGAVSTVQRLGLLLPDSFKMDLWDLIRRL